MRLLRSILKNTFFLTLGQVAAKIFNVVFIALLARAVGPDGVGRYVFAVSLIAIFMMLPNFGFDILLVREVSKSRERGKELISNVLIVKLLLSIITSLLMFSFAILREYDYQKIQIFLFVLISSIFTSLLSTLFSMFKAYEKMEYEAALIVLNSVLRVSSGVIAIKIGLELNGILLAILFADVLSFILSSIIFQINFKIPKLIINYRIIRQILKYSIPFGVLSLIDVIFVNTDNLMIAKLVNETAVGWYSAANRILLFILVIPNMLMNAIFPVMSRLTTSDNNSLRQTYSKSFSYMLMMAFPIAIGGFLVSDQIILLIYGEQFRNTIIIFQVMVWVTMFSFVGYVNGATLNATGREKMFAGMTGFATLFNIILDYIFIKRFGYIGACYSTLLLTCIGFIIYSTICHRQLKIFLELHIILKSLIAAIIMGGIIYFLKKIVQNLFILIPVGSLTYGALIILLRVLPKEDASALLCLVKRNID